MPRPVVGKTDTGREWEPPRALVWGGVAVVLIAALILGEWVIKVMVIITIVCGLALLAERFRR